MLFFVCFFQLVYQAKLGLVDMLILKIGERGQDLGGSVLAHSNNVEEDGKTTYVPNYAS